MIVSTSKIKLFYQQDGFIHEEQRIASQDRQA